MFNSIPIRRSFLPEEGCKSVEDTMRNFQIEPTSDRDKKSTMERVESVAASSENPGLATVTVSGGGKIIRSEATVRNKQ